MLALAAWAAEDGITSKPFVPLGPGKPCFEELSAEDSGIDFINSWQAPPEFESALTLSFVAGGVAIGDYDNDGCPTFICLDRLAVVDFTGIRGSFALKMFPLKWGCWRRCPSGKRVAVL